MKVKRKHNERDLQMRIAGILRRHRAHGVVYWHTPNSTQGANFILGAMNKAMGVRAGVSDLVILIPRDTEGPSVAFLELKSEYGRTSADQDVFLDEARALGCQCLVSSHYDEILSWLAQIGAVGFIP